MGSQRSMRIYTCGYKDFGGLGIVPERLRTTRPTNSRYYFRSWPRRVERLPTSASLAVASSTGGV